MSVKCRLRPLNLPPEITAPFLLNSIHDSDEIERKVYLEGARFDDFNNTAPYNFTELKQNKNLLQAEVTVELCCGTGDFIVNYAMQNRSRLFIAVDYAKPVIERAVLKAFQNQLENIYFYNGRIEDFFGYDFKGVLFDEILVNFPDPWPKKKHHKRRVIRENLIDSIASGLKPSGHIITATDVHLLHDDHVEVLNNSTLLEPAKSENDEFVPPLPIYLTRSSYERKGIEANRMVRYTKHIRK